MLGLAKPSYPHRRRRRVLVFAAVVAALGLVGIALAGVLCRVALDCHLRDVGLERYANYDLLDEAALPGTSPTALPPGFREEVVARGLALPTAFTVLPDGRTLVAEKNGVVRVVRDGKVLPRPLLDIRDRVNHFGLRGLVAVRHAPDFERSGLVYLLYSYEHSSQPLEYHSTVVRLSAFRVEGDVADASSERIVLGGAGKKSCNDASAGDCIPLEGDHLGGGLEFAPDGTLFVSTGDGWDARSGFDERPLRAQNLDSLAGKLLRITPEGDGAPSNPFWNGDAQAARSKVYAYGFRNPFRFTSLARSAVVVADVGWNEWEEVNQATPGANFGWPCYEGRKRLSAYRDSEVCRELDEREARFPLHAYPHGSVTGGSVTGGVVYDGTEFPAAYRGAYFLGDWLKSWIRYLPAGMLDRSAPGAARPFAERTDGPVEFAVAEDGSLLYLALNDGELRRIRWAGER